MKLPSYNDLTEPLSDYHQFLFELRRMGELSTTEIMGDEGLPLRFRFTGSSNQQPEVIKLYKTLENLSNVVNEFLLLPSQDYAPKAEILSAVKVKIAAELKMSEALLEYFYTKAKDENNGQPPLKYLHAGISHQGKFNSLYRALAVMQDALTGLKKTVSSVRQFMIKHKQETGAPLLVKSSLQETNPWDELLSRPFLTKKESAQVLGVSEDTIDNYIKKGILPKQQIAGKKKIMISVAEVKKLLP